MRDTLLMVMNIVIIIWNLLTNINDFAVRFFCAFIPIKR